VTLSPFPKPYQKICEQYCTSGMDVLGICNSNDGQEDYDKCINLTKPVGCNSLSNPIAAVGIDYYYINSIGSINCEKTSIC